jgi:PAS domain-containing protein
MAAMTALGHALVGTAELGLEHPRAIAASQWLVVAAGFVGLLNVLGYAYHLQGLDQLLSAASASTEMAVHTGAAFVVLAIAVLCARPDRGPMAVVTSESAGGVVARRLLPAAVGLPVLLGWLRLMGERAGLWTFPTGWGLLVVTTLALFVVIIWRSARTLHLTDARREQAEEALRRAHKDLEAQVRQRTSALTETVGALEAEVKERQRVEAALRESERRYRELVDASRGLICRHDLDGTLLSVNPAAA